MQVRFVPAATPERIAAAAALADKVWNEHYAGLLAPAQIAYMVDKFQSAGAIARQIAQEGYRYFLLELDGRAAGYTAVQTTGKRLFLSKLYIEKDARGQGAASQALAFLEGLCRRERLHAIWLTVNKGNASSIAVYKHWGFETVDTQVADIGGGFVMDDYIMERPVVGVDKDAARLPLRPFGRTGAMVSPLGFGAMRMPTTADGAIDEPAAIGLIRQAIDGGVNYVDTAYFYHDGKSEGLVGKALRDGYREKTYVATKSPVSLLHQAEDFDRILDEQLERLGLPYVDFYMFHAINRQEWREKVLGFGLIPRIEAARAAGKIRYIGFSFHDDNDAFHEIVDGYAWDFCQIQYNYVDVNNQAGTVGLEYAAGKGLAVIVMEPLLGGKLALPPEGVRRVLPAEKTPVEWALDFIWDRPEVSLLLSGMGSAQQVRDNLVYASRSGKGMLTGEERALFAGAKEAYDTMAKVPCTKCAYCMPCPFGVDIPGVFDAYNRSAFSQEEGETRYAALEGKAELCRACRKCEKVCPQHIVISERLLEARQALDRVDNHQ